MFSLEDISAVPTEAQRMRKRVSWAEDTSLVSVHYFEMDESERGTYMALCVHTCTPTVVAILV